MIIYLASPLGFTESTKVFMEKIELKLKLMGHEVINPWKLSDEKEIQMALNIDDYQLRKEMLHNIDIKIGYTNEMAIRRSDAILAVLDGTDVDSGTSAEIGFGYAIGKRIYGYRGDFRIAGDNEGCLVNLQIQYFIEQSGGKIIRSINEIKYIR